MSDYIKNITPSSLGSPKYGSIEPLNQIRVAPVTLLTIAKFSQWVTSKMEYHSSPFFAFEGGYQMCLKVDAAGS